jgi:hypothetical protein
MTTNCGLPELKAKLARQPRTGRRRQRFAALLSQDSAAKPATHCGVQTLLPRASHACARDSVATMRENDSVSISSA